MTSQQRVPERYRHPAVDRRRSRGFTLIELMIVVAILGIISTYAISSYREQTRKANRAAAKTEVLKAQQWMERFYSENFRYDLTVANGAVGPLFGAQFTTAPPPGEGNPAYDVTVNAAAQAFTVTATIRAAGPMNGDPCGSYVITNTGRKTVVNWGATYATALDAARACWR